MATEQSQSNVRHPSSVRMARAALLSERQSARMEQVREVFCEPTRAQILRALIPGPLTVNDLSHVIGRSKSATSQHLRLLKDDGFVTSRRRGRSVYYQLQRTSLVETTIAAVELVAAAA